MYSVRNHLTLVGTKYGKICFSLRWRETLQNSDNWVITDHRKSVLGMI